jgi:hypothetical protein
MNLLGGNNYPLAGLISNDFSITEECKVFRHFTLSGQRNEIEPPRTVNTLEKHIRE